MKKTLIALLALLMAAALMFTGLAEAAAADTAASTESAAEAVIEDADGDAEAEHADEGAGAEEEYDGETQYVLYLGTNDKDTNKPVFTQEEALAKAKEILIRHFGGYTIQEAHGGWIGDDGTEYTEYTLVIYLSDTTLDAVHAAADELVEAFNQSSVLIQANPTQTEFYGGSAG